MKKLLLFLVFFGFVFIAGARAEDIVENSAATGIKNITVTVLGLVNHEDYKFLLDGMRAIAGVEELIPSRISKGKTVFSGRISVEPAAFINDVQAFVMDRYSFGKKESGDSLEINLKKL